MAKNKRGKALYKLPSRSRGTCPICLATRIKLLETVKKTDGRQLNVCKRCGNASSARIEAAVDTSIPLAFRRKHRQTFHQLQAQLIKRNA